MWWPMQQQGDRPSRQDHAVRQQMSHLSILDAGLIVAAQMVNGLRRSWLKSAKDWFRRSSLWLSGYWGDQ